jgi:hypothetical protein
MDLETLLRENEFSLRGNFVSLEFDRFHQNFIVCDLTRRISGDETPFYRSPNFESALTQFIERGKENQ